MYYTEPDNDGVRHQKYLYNGDDERVIVITDGSLTGFLYDNGILIAEYDNGGSVSAQYIHGLGLGHDVGSLICKQTADDTQYSFYNYRGDVIDTLIGATITSYRYDAFGNLIDSSAPEFGFSSKRYDASTALSYFGARYYDASLGRFISRDPMGYIDGPNMYVYVSNNALFYIDPTGNAQRASRPLDIKGLRRIIVGNVRHDGFIYEDGTITGYFSGDGVREDDGFTRNDYDRTRFTERYNDKTLEAAERITRNTQDWSASAYSIFTNHQCQNYCDAVEVVYTKLVYTQLKIKAIKVVAEGIANLLKTEYGTNVKNSFQNIKNTVLTNLTEDNSRRDTYIFNNNDNGGGGSSSTNFNQNNSNSVSPMKRRTMS